MKIIFRVDDVLPSLLNVSSVVSNRSVMEILDCVLFELHNDVLKMSASDNDTLVLQSVRVSVSDARDDFSFCLNAKDLTKVLSSLVGYEIELTIEETCVVGKYTNGTFTLPIKRAADFPILFTSGEATLQSVDLPIALLTDGLNFTRDSTGDDSLRPILSGVCIDFSNQAVSFYGTDAQKLSKYDAHVDSNIEGKIVLPKKPSTILSKSLSSKEGSVKIEFDEKKARFTADGFVLTTKLIEVMYPNVSSIIPQSAGNVLTIEKNTILKALKRILPLGSISELVVLDVSLGNLAINSENIEFSTKATETIDCDYSGVPMKIGFKGTNLTQTIANIPSQEIKIALYEPSRAAVFAPKSVATDVNMLALLMPMMINS